MGGAVVLDSEKITNETADTLAIKGQERSVIRDPSRDELTPRKQQKKGGMWAEINHAVLLNIPVVSGQTAIGRTRPQRRDGPYPLGDL